MPSTVIIDRQQWDHGINGSGDFTNKENKKLCILAFILQDIGIDPYTCDYNVAYTENIPNKLISKSMELNDNKQMNDTEREAQLIELLKEFKLLEFIN